MGWLSPLLLASAAVMAVPLWLHLKRRRRRNPVEFPSLRYLRVAAARMRPQARVEDVWLLALRVLLVVLLAAAFARPVLRQSSGTRGGERAVESLVVMDATASMGYRTQGGVARFELAKRLAREWIGGLAGSDAVALWVLTDRLEKPVPDPVTDRDHLLSQLAALQVGEGSATLAQAFHAARGWVAQGGVRQREIVIVTDNQRAVWDWPAGRFFQDAWDREACRLVVLATDAEQAGNTAVQDVTWSARDLRPGGLMSGVAKLANHGNQPVTDLLECRVAGQVALRQPVEIPARGTIDVPLALAVPATRQPVLTGEVALAGDLLGCDDRWHFALPVRQPAASVIVEPAGLPLSAMRPSFFLSRALAAGGAGSAAVIDTAAWPHHATTGIDAVWFAGTGSIGGADEWSKALAFAEAGGTVIVAADVQPGSPPADWPVLAGPEIDLPAGRIATRLLAPGHPLFDGVWGASLPFPPLPQRTARDTRPATGSRVLATMAGELPFIVERPHGDGVQFWWNTSLDRSWGDLPLSPAYVALVQQIAAWRGLAGRAPVSLWVGAPLPALAGRPPATWPADGARVAGGSRVVRSGVFDAQSADGTVAWSCAVNVRREEADLLPVPTGELEGILPGRALNGAAGLREWRAQAGRELPLWPWLLAVAAVVFLAEGWLAAWAAKTRQGSVTGQPAAGWRGKEARP